MADSGIRLIGLGALGYDARPEYNKTTAGKLRKVGMDILVCTPEKLAECMAQIIRSPEGLAKPVRELDAGSWFRPEYRGERVPSLPEALSLCGDEIDVLLDLKEQGEGYAQAVAEAVRAHGRPERIIVGVRSVEQARQFRELLPAARQLGLISAPGEIEAFAEAGVETIRLWPKWLEDARLVSRVRAAGAMLHLNGTSGAADEVQRLLEHGPDSLSSDDPARLVKTLIDLPSSRE
jgi:glycerophosphoryl diester phosphodiesterase